MLPYLFLILVLISSCNRNQNWSDTCAEVVETSGQQSWTVRWKNQKLTLEKFFTYREKENFETKHSLEILRMLPNRKLKPSPSSSDFSFKSSRELSSRDRGTLDSYYHPFQDLPKIWEQGIRGQGVVVAVIDTPIDQDWFADSLFVNSGEIPGNNIDDDQNGWIDDVEGYDFYYDKSFWKKDSWYEHGSKVVSIISSPRGEGRTSVAPLAKILPLSVSDNLGTDIDSYKIAKAVDYAKSQGVDIINISLVSSCPEPLEESFESLKDTSIIVVSAAGNDSKDLRKSPEYPASFSYPWVVSVGALNEYQERASFSNYAPFLLYAPGDLVAETWKGPVLFTGTSASAPFVSGVLALLLSAFPDSSREQRLSALYSSREEGMYKLNIKKSFDQLLFAQKLQ